MAGLLDFLPGTDYGAGIVGLMAWLDQKKRNVANSIKGYATDPAQEIAQGASYAMEPFAQLQQAKADWQSSDPETKRRGQDAMMSAVVNAGLLSPLVTVYHGTPHKFDRYDLSKIGTGEGAQAYGPGMYFAENPKVAKEYQKINADIPVAVVRDASGKIIATNSEVTNSMLEAWKWVESGRRDAGQFPHNTAHWAKKNYEKSFARFPEMLQQADKQEVLKSIDAIANGKLKIGYEKVPGTMYQQDLPDEVLPSLLQWDKQLSEQPQKVKELLRGSRIAPDESVWPHYTGEQMIQGEASARGPYNAAGWPLPEARIPIADELKRLGIPGLSYLDAGSRTGGKGTMNHVIWDQSLLDRMKPMPVIDERLLQRFVTPQEKALLTAQRNAALPVEQGGLGLSAANTQAERAATMGFNGDMYHGTERLDRLLAKPGLDPKRATSGPMPFFTSDPEIASNYAKSKADTSRVATDTGNVADYFQVSPKDLGHTRGRTPYTVEQSWHFLTPEQKATISDRATRVGYENQADYTGPFKLHPPGIDATLSADHYQWVLKHEARGNPLTALREMWHDGGQLVGDEEKLAEIYKLAGYPHPISQANAPWTSAEGVLPAKLRMGNALDTSKADLLREQVIPKLEQAFKGDRSRTQQYGADMWDKNTRYTPKEWVAQLKADLAKGDNSYVWTSIPDKVTAALKAQGWEGVIDRGGKGGGAGHDVYIPFDPSQVRSKFAAFDPKRKESADLLASMSALGLLGTAYGTLDNGQ